MVFWAALCLRALPSLTRPLPREKRAKQEGPEGSTKEGKVIAWTCAKTTGTKKVMTPRNHLFGWEGERLQTKPSLGDKTSKAKGKTRAWFRAEKNSTNTQLRREEWFNHTSYTGIWW